MQIHFANSYRQLIFIGLISIVSAHAPGQDAQPPQPGATVEKLSSVVPEVQALVAGPWTKRWCESIAKLSPIAPKSISWNGKEVVIDEAMFYSARYGSPLAYARALDLAERNGFRPQENARVVDFGYGSIGHLRMLALSGIDATGIDVAPMLTKIYEGADGRLEKGNVRLLHGRFPVDEHIANDVGNGYDLFLSKNTLKKGYIHPSREVPDERMVIRLGVSDREFLNKVHALLKPNGLIVIYNFCPAKAGESKPYVPWSEGESPFTRDGFDSCGFEVLEFDIVDDVEARKLARALAWDTEGGMDLEKDLFAWYTIARKKL